MNAMSKEEDEYAPFYVDASTLTPAELELARKRDLKRELNDRFRTTFEHRVIVLGEMEDRLPDRRTRFLLARSFGRQRDCPRAFDHTRARILMLTDRHTDLEPCSRDHVAAAFFPLRRPACDLLAVQLAYRRLSEHRQIRASG